MILFGFVPALFHPHEPILLLYSTRTDGKFKRSMTISPKYVLSNILSSPKRSINLWAGHGTLCEILFGNRLVLFDFVLEEHVTRVYLKKYVCLYSTGMRHYRL